MMLVPMMSKVKEPPLVSAQVPQRTVMMDFFAPPILALQEFVKTFKKPAQAATVVISILVATIAPEIVLLIQKIVMTTTFVHWEIFATEPLEIVQEQDSSFVHVKTFVNLQLVIQLLDAYSLI